MAANVVLNTLNFIFFDQTNKYIKLKIKNMNNNQFEEK